MTRHRQNYSQRTYPSTSAIEGRDQQAGSNSSPAAAVGLQRPTAGHDASRESPARLVPQRLLDRQQALSSEAPASQGRSSRLWTRAETDQLARLVSLQGSTRRIDWTAIYREWQSLGPQRTKAALQAKWCQMGRDSATASSRHITSARIIASGPEVGSTGPIARGGLNSVGHSPAEETSLHRSGRGTALVGHNDRTAASMADATSTCVQVGPCVQPTSARTVNGDLGGAGVDAGDPLDEAVNALFKRNLAKASKAKSRLSILPKRVNSKRALGTVLLVEQCVERELSALPRITWETLTSVVFAAASTVTQIVRKEDQQRSLKERCWFAETRRKMKALRCLIGKATSELERRKADLKVTRKQIQNIRMLKRGHKSETSDEIKSLVEQLKNRLQLLKSRYDDREREMEQRKLRNTFSLSRLSRHTKSPDSSEASPNLAEVRRFWRKIVGTSKQFNPSDDDLLDSTLR